ncbi:MAG: DUF1559 domain-containing protein, partial [Phycisphaeraceae bacterium]|nr:DUF1559 domain-containing protein [Phycisphaeraceae bacterium]
IIALLIAILLPALARAREAGRALVCMNNLRQMNLAIMGYMNDFTKDHMLPAYDRYPGGFNVHGLDLVWNGRYYDPSTGILTCPSDQTEDFMGYPSTCNYTMTKNYNRSYVWNIYTGYRYYDGTFFTPFWRLTALKYPSRDILMWCSDWPHGSFAYLLYDWTGYLQPAYQTSYPLWHDGSTNVMCMDGHSQRITPQSYVDQFHTKGDWNY